MEDKEEIKALVRPVKQYQGQREMRNLASRAITAIEHAGLPGLLHELNTRVFERPNEDICEEVQLTPTMVWCCYKPFVELLLHHIVAVMDPKGELRTRGDQVEEIRWAMEHGGF